MVDIMEGHAVDGDGAVAVVSEIGVMPVDGRAPGLVDEAVVFQKIKVRRDHGVLAAGSHKLNRRTPLS